MSIRCPISSSAARPPPADWPCRLSVSSPDQQTSRAWFGLALACATLLRISGDDGVDRRFDRAHVSHLLHAARLHDRNRIAAYHPYDLKQILGDFAGDDALRNQIDDGARACADTGERAMSTTSLFSGRTIR